MINIGPNPPIIGIQVVDLAVSTLPDEFVEKHELTTH